MRRPGQFLPEAPRANVQPPPQEIPQGDQVEARGSSRRTLRAPWGRPSAKVTQLLVDARAVVNAQGPIDLTPLQAAEKSGWSSIARLLLDAHADAGATSPARGAALAGSGWVHYVGTLGGGGQLCGSYPDRRSTEIIPQTWSGT